jgi:hypothetical protein
MYSQSTLNPMSNAPSRVRQCYASKLANRQTATQNCNQTPDDAPEQALRNCSFKTRAILQQFAVQMSMTLSHHVRARCVHTHDFSSLTSSHYQRVSYRRIPVCTHSERPLSTCDYTDDPQLQASASTRMTLSRHWGFQVRYPTTNQRKSLLLHSEDWHSSFHRYVGTYQQNYTASHTTRA